MEIFLFIVCEAAWLSEWAQWHELGGDVEASMACELLGIAILEHTEHIA